VSRLLYALEVVIVAQTVPPKADAVRRNSRVGPLRLPSEGRDGEPPVWPLPGHPIAAEREAWSQLWRTPQAVAWERLGWTRTVARYCRVMVESEKRNAPAKALMEARQLEDRLGLTPKAMRMLLWEIVVDEVKQHREASSARERIKAVT
jgi:hypothetical protein